MQSMLIARGRIGDVHARVRRRTDEKVLSLAIDWTIYCRRHTPGEAPGEAPISPERLARACIQHGPRSQRFHSAVRPHERAATRQARLRSC